MNNNGISKQFKISTDQLEVLESRISSMFNTECTILLTCEGDDDYVAVIDANHRSYLVHFLMLDGEYPVPTETEENHKTLLLPPFVEDITTNMQNVVFKSLLQTEISELNELYANENDDEKIRRKKHYIFGIIELAYRLDIIDHEESENIYRAFVEMNANGSINIDDCFNEIDSKQKDGPTLKMKLKDMMFRMVDPEGKPYEFGWDKIYGYEGEENGVFIHGCSMSASKADMDTLTLNSGWLDEGINEELELEVFERKRKGSGLTLKQLHRKAMDDFKAGIID